MVVVGKLGFDGYQYIALKSEIAAIKDETNIAFKSALSEEFGDISPGQERSVMEQVLQRKGSGNDSLNFQAMLATIARVTNGQNIMINELSFKNEELLVTCQLNDFSQVDTLTKQINASARLSASLQSSETDKGKVIASYLVKSKNG